MKVHRCDTCGQVAPSSSGWYRLKVQTPELKSPEWDMGEYCSASCVSKAVTAHEQKVEEAQAELEAAH